jgi:hypothetical protein
MAPAIGFVWGLVFVAIYPSPPPAFTFPQWAGMWIAIYTGGGLLIGVVDLMRRRDDNDPS